MHLSPAHHASAGVNDEYHECFRSAFADLLTQISGFDCDTSVVVFMLAARLLVGSSGPEGGVNRNIVDGFQITVADVPTTPNVDLRGCTPGETLAHGPVFRWLYGSPIHWVEVPALRDGQAPCPYIGILIAVGFVIVIFVALGIVLLIAPENTLAEVHLGNAFDAVGKCEVLRFLDVRSGHHIIVFECREGSCNTVDGDVSA
jgi:hypothetical protein